MKRIKYLNIINEQFKINPVVALLGPRQCGKTTLAHQYKKQVKGEIHFFDLEDPEDLAALENPKIILESLRGTLVFDEIQRRPALFPYLRTLIDKENRRRKILILGSASRDLIQQSSETLAGRISHLELTPFSLQEISKNKLNTLWERGGYPVSFLAQSERDSYNWRKAYISTFLERDIPALGIRIPAPSLRRFWQMLAHYQGQVVNYSELGRSFGASDTTIRGYLDILTETFMTRQLQPWHANIKKRQVKRPKLYLRDSGIYHSLLAIKSKSELLRHPKLGASWEGFALEQVIAHFELESDEIYFWGVHNQGELDLFFLKDGMRIGVEFKFSDAPTLTKSMEFSERYLELNRLICIYPGKKRYPLSEKIEVCGLAAL